MKMYWRIVSTLGGIAVSLRLLSLLVNIIVWGSVVILTGLLTPRGGS